MTFKKKLFVYLFFFYYIWNHYFLGEEGIVMRSVKLCVYVERGGNNW